MAKDSKSWRNRVRVRGGKVIVKSELPKLSDTMIAFARPLLDGLPNDPPSIEQVRHVMGLATILWNLPLLEDGDASFGADVCASLDEVQGELGEVQAVLDAMLEERRAKWGHDRRVVSVEVVEVEGGYQVVAEGVELEG
jgi:hypothetical protein